MGYQKVFSGKWRGRSPAPAPQTTSRNDLQGIYIVTITRIGSNPKYASNFDRAFGDSKPKKKTTKKKKAVKKKATRKSKR